MCSLALCAAPAEPLPLDGRAGDSCILDRPRSVGDRAGCLPDDFAREVTDRAPGCAVTGQTDCCVAIEIALGAGTVPILGLLKKRVNIDLDTFGVG